VTKLVHATVLTTIVLPQRVAFTLRVHVKFARYTNKFYEFG